MTPYSFGGGGGETGLFGSRSRLGGGVGILAPMTLS